MKQNIVLNNKNEFNNFINCKYYNINNVPYYVIKEKNAVGLHICIKYVNLYRIRYISCFVFSQEINILK